MADEKEQELDEQQLEQAAGGTYQKITWTAKDPSLKFVDGGVTHEDTWEKQQIKGAIEKKS
jgi:hypothetical protein